MQRRDSCWTKLGLVNRSPRCQSYASIVVDNNLLPRDGKLYTRVQELQCRGDFAKNMESSNAGYFDDRGID